MNQDAVHGAPNKMLNYVILNSYVSSDLNAEMWKNNFQQAFKCDLLTVFDSPKDHILHYLLGILGYSRVLSLVDDKMLPNCFHVYK